MPVASVSLGPALKAWADAGLTHFLLEGTLAEFETVVTERPAVPHRNPVPEAITEHAVSSVPATSAALTFVSADASPLSPDAWPKEWRDWFVKTSPAPVLWTYHELGADVTGIGRSQERSTFFRNLIGELALPKGSSVFWPCAMPASSSDPTLVSDAGIFAAGLRRLMPQLVVVFGESALDDIGLTGKAGNFGQVMVEGKLVVVLPGIDALLQGAAQRSSAVSLLRALFASVRL
ncbi:MAG: hypothetical protein DELT_00023 [Desulfovibrio sp.]